MSMYLLDEYVATQPGEPYRLFPFGYIIKNGKRREVTPELARKFRLPHFKPPVKLGSHDEKTPAGGHILALEVRDDGLWAIPELNEQGAQAIVNGNYRYHSPEVIWDEGGGYEDPTTGDIITGPLIVGDALLHTPHLGEAAALYSVEQAQHTNGGTNMTEETIQVPKTFWEGVLDVFRSQPKPEPEVEEAQPIQVEQFEAIKAEKEALEARLQEIEQEKQHAARVAHYAAQLTQTKAENAAEMLAGMSDEQAAWVLEQFKALSAQVNDSALLGEIGDETPGEPVGAPMDVFDAKIKAFAAEHKVSYSQAVSQVSALHPDLAHAAGYK